ncbi:hypothetical protein [Thauera sinica]|uniref:Uncharacterized protein n=1 Tax=Thauera sinica TaxID=2665146 RepID=A0ABW1AVA1_9RHOO|nr:hypothetical protein [Thauera sp. K11]
MMLLKKMVLIILMIAGGVLFLASMYAMFNYDLPWATKKWGYEKPGPWFLGVIGLVVAGWSFIEFRMLERREEGCVNSIDED